VPFKWVHNTSCIIQAIIAKHGRESLLATAVGRDFKGKISPIIYAIAIGTAFVSPWISQVLYVLVAAMWLIPDRRIENALVGKKG
jgi:uncharacterized membrane protein